MARGNRRSEPWPGMVLPSLPLARLGAMSDASPAGPDWTDQVTDRIESVVGMVRDRTTVPILKLVRALIFVVVAGVLGIVALILLIVSVLRLHVYLPVHPEARKVWVSYVGLGA